MIFPLVTIDHQSQNHQKQGEHNQHQVKANIESHNQNETHFHEAKYKCF